MNLQGVRAMFKKDLANALRKKVSPTKGGARKCDTDGYFNLEVAGDFWTLVAVMSHELLVNARLTWSGTQQNTVQVTSVCRDAVLMNICGCNCK